MNFNFRKEFKPVFAHKISEELFGTSKYEAQSLFES